MTARVPDTMTKSMLRAGYDFFASVPCGMLSPIIRQVDITSRDRGLPHVLAPREDIALGVACGAFLAGRRPLVLMQNSGLGQSVNAIASLIKPFHLPISMVVSIRGYKGGDTEENRMMGEITKKLLDDMRVPTTILTTENVEQAVDWARAMTDTGMPCAILVTPHSLGGPSDAY
ncbi:sulfopyruvate decarboxylase subunit alpha [Sulfuriferula plumbiphila]|uniref:sulfopyruvate decarboxylase subunit alpha n=1 Tax=Sulfuriferula plumbiphila TaxID=171865 RepID=UPI0011BE5A10|nr:sulfopyruvate decarboxylase subunit alpha [Sulfuriferula plumbiphila]